MTPLQLEAVRTCADVVATAFVSIGLPLLGAWAVRKHLIQQRWVTIIEAAAATGLNAGRCAGTIDSPAFRRAAGAAILDYAKAQGADVLSAKGLTDDATLQAGLARLSKLTDGTVGPTGTANTTDAAASKVGVV